MNKLPQTALIPAALALTLTAALTTAHAQTTTAQPTQTQPNVLFLMDTGRPGAVDVYVDGTRVEAGVQASSQPSALSVTPGAHSILVKTSGSGAVVARTSVNVQPNSFNAVSLQNNYDTGNGNLSDYTLTFASGSTAVKTLINSD